MKKIVHLLMEYLFFLSLLAACTTDNLPESFGGVMLQPAFSLTPIQAQTRTAQTFQPMEGSRFTIGRTEGTTAIYTLKEGKMVSDVPLLLPKSGSYPFRVYGKSGDIPVVFYDNTEVDKEGNASFQLHIACAAIQVYLQTDDGSPIAEKKATISLPNLYGTGAFKTDFTVADETAVEVAKDVHPSGQNEEEILFHPQNNLTGGQELITIQHEGKTYNYSPASIPDFKAGKRYIYTLRLGTVKAELVTEDITDFIPFILNKENNNNLRGIYTEEDLIAFRDAMNANASIDEWTVTDASGNTIINLYNDITLTQEWIPIDVFNKLRFYGNGKTISNITIKGSEVYNGFFGKITSGIIFNLNFADIKTEYTPTATSYCGVICGFASSASIQNVYLKNIVMTTTTTGAVSSQTGICMGQSKNSKLKDVSIENATITGTGSSNVYIGGVCGYANISSMEKITLSGIQVQGTCTGSSTVYAGGLSGMNAATCPIQTASLNKIKVEANAVFYAYCGGMIGSNTKNDSPISQSKLTDITTSSSTSKLVNNYIGGLAGYNSQSPINNIELSDIKSTAEASAVYSTTDDKYKPYLCNAGGIGRNGASLHNVHASNLQITTSSPVEQDITFLGSGGLIGFYYYTPAPTMTLCSTDQCTVKGYRAGGMVGYNYNGNLIGCSATNADVYATLYSGGLIGYNPMSTKIFGCYSTGKVTTDGVPTQDKKLYAGGLIGMGGNTIEVSYSTCDVTNNSENCDDYDANSYAGSFLGGGGRNFSISCYATGKVNGKQERYFAGNPDLYEFSEIQFCYTTQTAFVRESRAASQLGGSANWDQHSPLPEEILRSKASITLDGITWKASSLWLVTSKGAHPVINMNYHGE